MNFNSFKAAVFDLDGTLAEYGSDRISLNTIQAVKHLVANGTEVTIATGRSWRQTRTIVANLDIKIPVIVQAGAIIIDPITERVLKFQPLRSEINNKIQHFLDDPDVDQFCLSETGAYYTTKISTSGGSWLRLNSGEACYLTTTIEQFHPVVKRLFIGTEDKLRRISEWVKQRVRPIPNMILWPPDQLTGDWFLEIFDPLSSKGQAVSWLAKRLGISCKEIIAFGDGANDLDLLQTAGLAVAINGAPPELLKQADLIIPGPAEEGIARLIRGGLTELEKDSKQTAS